MRIFLNFMSVILAPKSRFLVSKLTQQKFVLERNDVKPLIIFDSFISMKWKRFEDDDFTISNVHLSIQKKRILDNLTEMYFQITPEYDIFYRLEGFFTDKQFEFLKSNNNFTIHFEKFGYEIVNIIKKQKHGDYDVDIYFTEDDQGDGEFIIDGMTGIQRLNILKVKFKKMDPKRSFRMAMNRINSMNKMILEQYENNDKFYNLIKREDPVFYDIHYRSDHDKLLKVMKKSK